MSGNEITTKAEYATALERMDALFDDYETNKPEIELLAGAIERWEDQSEEFAPFNAVIAIYKEGAPEGAQKTDAAADEAAY